MHRLEAIAVLLGIKDLSYELLEWLEELSEEQFEACFARGECLPETAYIKMRRFAELSEEFATRCRAACETQRAEAISLYLTDFRE